MSPAKPARKYVPKPEGLNLEFHLACLETGTLCIQRCADCGLFRHPQRWYCPACHSRNYDFAPVAGSGHIYSMAVNHFTIDRGRADELPYITAVVELDEGPRVVGSLRDVGPGEASLRQPVRVSAEPRGTEFASLWVETA